MTTESTQTIKTCSKCQRDLPITAFAKRTRSKDGLQAYCRQCNGAKTNEPQYKVHPLKMPDFDPITWHDSFIRTTATCLWCRDEAKCLLVDGQVESPTEDIVERARLADVWCGSCDRKENLRSRQARKLRAAKFEDTSAEAFAWHDSLKANSRTALKENALPGHSMAVEGFLRRVSHERADYFEVIDRYKVLDSKRHNQINRSEVRLHDHGQVDGILTGEIVHDPFTNRLVSTKQTIDY